MKLLSHRDFRLASCQATLVTPDLELPLAALARDLVPRWMTRFDGEPMMAPYVQGMSRDAPRLLLQSVSGAWRCEISAARINLFWRRPALSDEVPDLCALFADIRPVLDEYVAALGTRVGRLAAVASWFGLHNSPGLFLAQHFCQERWLEGPYKRPEHFEINAHMRSALGGKYLVNSWLKNVTGLAAQDGGGHPAVLVEGDVNTLAEETAARSFEPSELREFFDLAAAELDAAIARHYPT